MQQDNSTRVIGGFVWFNVFLAVLLLFMGRSFPQYALAKLSGNPYHTGVNWTAGEKAGTEVDYFDLQGYTAITDIGIFFCGVVVLLEAAAMLLLSRGKGAPSLLWITLALTALVTAWNFFVMLKLFQFGILPAITLLTVAYGGFIAFEQWQALKNGNE